MKYSNETDSTSGKFNVKKLRAAYKRKGKARGLSKTLSEISQGEIFRSIFRIPEGQSCRTYLEMRSTQTLMILFRTEILGTDTLS